MKQKRLPERAFERVTLEFLLEKHPNGGGLILIRTVWIALLIYTLALSIKHFLSSETIVCIDWDGAKKIISETLGWYGAIFAGVYATLISRFASQWHYLANLYNQMMATAVQTSKGEEKERSMNYWRAAFIEDAVELHLARKRIFASVIRSMLDKEGVRNAIEKYADQSKCSLEKVSELVNWQRDQSTINLTSSKTDRSSG